MKINKLFIKILLFFNFINIIFGAIQDPVARHDLLECATYLCPTYRNMAEDYMKNGCVGEFKDFFNENFKESKEENSLNMISKNNVSNKTDIDINTVFVLTTLSSLISLYVGFVYAKREQMNEIKYLMNVL